jgi:hypothetical protein
MISYLDAFGVAVVPLNRTDRVVGLHVRPIDGLEVPGDVVVQRGTMHA